MRRQFQPHRPSPAAAVLNRPQHTGEAHHSNRHEWPFVVVGGRNLRLRTAGRYLRYANYGRNGHRTIGNWYNSLLQATGFRPQDHIGQTDPNLRDLNLIGPLTELMA